MEELHAANGRCLLQAQLKPRVRVGNELGRAGEEQRVEVEVEGELRRGGDRGRGR
jgi:hypothetical protein